MINKLSEEIYANAKSKGFYDDGEAQNIGERLALIHSEVSEALEADRKNKYAIETYNINNNIHLDVIESMSDIQYFKQEFEAAYKDTFEDELADIMIRVMDMAAFKGIDLEKHIAFKMKYNSFREHKHGKKY